MRSIVLLTMALTLLAGTPVWAADPTPEELSHHALTHDGVAARGAVLFEEMGCASCHGRGGQGTSSAPALLDLGQQYDRAEIIRSVLEPSDRIAEGFQEV